jgi:hypothetical protein
MPGFSQYSQVVKPAEYVEPVSLDLLAKGTMYKEQMLEKNLEEVNSLVSYMDNIPSLQGIDTEKKNEILNNVKQQASQLSYSDLANPSVANQLKSYITSVTKDPDMQGIMQRGYSYETMLKDKKDVEAKGGQYFNYGLRQAQKYMESGKYLRDTTFSNLGGIAPNEADILKKAKDLCEKKITRVKVGNQYELKTQYDPEDLAAAIQTVSSGYSNYNLYHKFQFDGTTEGTDWTEYANNHFTPIISTAKTNLDLANANYSKATKESDKAYYKKYADYYSNQINEYSKLMNNPTATEEIKQKAFNDYQNEILNNQVSAMDAIQQSELKMDDNVKMKLQLSNSLALEDRRAKNAQDLAILKGEMKYSSEGTNPGILKSDLHFLHNIINPLETKTPMTVNLGERNKYYWTKEDIKNDKNILIKPEVKDRMDEPSGKNGEWYSIKGVDLLNKLNGTGNKVSTSYKYDEAGNQIGGGTENTTGKNYKYLFKDKNSGKVIALVSVNGVEGWETIDNETVASGIDKGIYGNSKNFAPINNEVEDFRSGYTNSAPSMPSGGGNVPFVAITENNLGNYLSIDEINGAIDKNPNYTESYLTNKINEIRKQFNTEDPTTIKSYLNAIISK